MIKSYNEFMSLLNKRIKDDNFIYDYLVTVVRNPNRYTGIFRLSNAKTKLIQNITQSREIKFGDFMEELITEYIADMGYKNLDKKIGYDEDNNLLCADQIFTKDNTVYLIEQKIRDDHDSTKKRGQYSNFQKKYSLLKKSYPSHNLNAIMWFIDERFSKNQNYYTQEAENHAHEGIDINIVYGGALFSNIFNRPEVWQEICDYLTKNKQERSNEILNIPDFDTSEEVKNAIKKLQQNNPKLYEKLISDVPEYIELRNELFPSGINI